MSNKEPETITLTRELIDALKRNGSYTTATIEALGLKWKDMSKGWTRRLVGMRVKTSDYDKAFAGREIMAKEHRARKSGICPDCAFSFGTEEHESLCRPNSSSAVGGTVIETLAEKRERMITAADKPENQAYYTKVAAEEFPPPPVRFISMADRLVEMKAKLNVIRLEKIDKMLDEQGVPEWVELEENEGVLSNCQPSRLKWYLLRRKDVKPSEKEREELLGKEMEKFIDTCK